MEIFITAVVLALVALAIKYFLDHQKSKSSVTRATPEVQPEQAPYKVEPPVEYATAIDVSPELVAKSAQAVPAAPELKVVTGAKKPAAKRSTAPKTKPVAKPRATAKPKVAPTPKKPATPKPTK